MKNKDKYDLRLLNIKEYKGKTRLDFFITYVEIKYFGTIIGEYQYIDENGVKKFFEWLEEDDGKECKPKILTEKEEVKKLKEFENPVLIASDENLNSIVLAEFINEECSKIYGKMITAIAKKMYQAGYEHGQIDYEEAEDEE